MRLHRFFVPDLLEGKEYYRITDKNLVHQMRNVLRMTTGGKLVLIDGTGFEYAAFIVAISPLSVECQITAFREAKTNPRRDLVLAFAVIKKDKAEWVVEKGTELGVSLFAPFVCQRSEKKSLNTDRLKLIAREATEQSERAIIPSVLEPSSFSDTVSAFHERGVNIILDKTGDPLPDSIKEGDGPVVLFVGPEGGFADVEIREARQKGVKHFSLGRATLRAETASLAAATLLLL